jgi:hypothetical protein
MLREKFESPEAPGPPPWSSTTGAPRPASATKISLPPALMTRSNMDVVVVMWRSGS